MLSGTNLTYTKAYNFRIVFETIRLHGPISRADIARSTNLTAQTVSNIVSRLLERQFVKEGRKLQKKRGAPSITLEINPAGAYSVGLDFNRDHLTGILVDLNGTVRTKIFYDIDSPTPEKAIELMVSTVNQLISLDEVKNAHFCGVGIGLPGPLEITKNNEVKNTINPKAFPNWKNVPVGEMLKKHISAPIFIQNNASAATIGERWYGAGKNISNFTYAFFGVGLGGGVVLNGNLYEGHNKNSGEFGFLPYFGAKSPLSDSEFPHIGEHFNLKKLYEWLTQFGLKVNRPEDMEQLLHDKSKPFIDWLELSKQYLATIFNISDYLIDTEVIILGGRLPNVVIEEFLKDIPALMQSNRIDFKNSIPKFLAGTAGTDAAALGAATLPIFDLFSAQKEILLKN
ncbi:MAG: ROK family transcriptional regulator [Balneolaceae bacterium]